MTLKKKNISSKNEALLLYAESEGDANMLYATGFFVPDPFLFFRHRGRKYVVMSDLEIDRAKKQADVDTVLSLSEYQARLHEAGRTSPTTADVVELIFKERSIRQAQVPSNFPTFLADELRRRAFKLEVRPDPFFSGRERKTQREVQHISDSLRVAEIGLEAGIETLKKARIGKDNYLYLNGTKLTSEKLKTVVNTAIMAEGWVPSHTIISSGNQCCDPHHEGSGPVKAHASIIFDIFPRSQRSGYFGDLSRTVARGRPSDSLKKLYATVEEGQKLGFELIRSGINGRAVHQKILELFEKRGFHTGKINGRMQGFFHGTGHGLGLNIHEPPRIAAIDATLRKGHVVTVEPGLYYIGVGGVRLEDVVLVTEKGNRNLTQAPRFLEI